MRLKCLVITCHFVSLIFVSQAVEADPSADFDCRTRLADVSAAPAFRDFPVSPSVPARPAKPKLISPDARMFRTTLQEGAAKGANFAGHYAIVVWGCGSSCSDLAIVDTRSGDVHFDDRVRDISTVNVNDEPGREQPEFWAARFRLAVGCWLLSARRRKTKSATASPITNGAGHVSSCSALFRDRRRVHR
jgi:hypothetical protein